MCIEETLLNHLIVFVIKRRFFVCKNYLNARNNPFDLLLGRVEETILINTHLLLSGCEHLSYNLTAKK